MMSLWASVILVMVLDPHHVFPRNQSKPNFVLMMVDDLGIGDLGCYGNTTLRTPNIDRLASEGVKLTHHIAAAPLCSPSRAAFLTGRYPKRYGVVGSDKIGVFLFNAGSGGLPNTEVTFSSIAKQQGYETALIGKWHLGLNCETRDDHCHHPNNHGFTYFYGIPLTNLRDCHPGKGSVFQFQKYLPFKTVGLIIFTTFLLHYAGVFHVPRSVRIGVKFLVVSVTFSLVGFLLAVPYMNCLLMRDGEILQQPFSTVNLTQKMTNEAVSFIERSSEGPFLLFLTFLQVHTALFVSEEFKGSSPHGIYGDAVQEVDWSVGQILQTLQRLGLSENTVLYLTSDQGAHVEEVSAAGERHGGSNGIYKSGKATNFEGGIRVPGLVRWTGAIEAGGEIDEPTSNMDLFPTIVHLSGGDMPTDRMIDGHNMLELLKGRADRSEHEFMFHYCNSRLNAVRWHPRNTRSVYKAFYFTPVFSPINSSGCYHTHVCFCTPEFTTAHSPPLVYDLTRDPSESSPLDRGSEPGLDRVISVINQAVREHQQTLTQVECQMTGYKLFPKPWLQPCCSSPRHLCQCQNE